MHTVIEGSIKHLNKVRDLVGSYPSTNESNLVINELIAWHLSNSIKYFEEFSYTLPIHRLYKEKQLLGLLASERCKLNTTECVTDYDQHQKIYQSSVTALNKILDHIKQPFLLTPYYESSFSFYKDGREQLEQIANKLNSSLQTTEEYDYQLAIKLSNKALLFLAKAANQASDYCQSLKNLEELQTPQSYCDSLKKFTDELIYFKQMDACLYSSTEEFVGDTLSVEIPL